MLDNIGCWNVRGLNQSSKQKEVRNFISVNNLGLMAVFESQISKVNLNKVCEKVFGRWKWISNSSVCRGTTRIIIGWNPNVFDVNMMDMNDQVMHCKIISSEGKEEFFGSFLYAANKHIDRRKLWDSLKTQNIVVDKKPWFLMGDFNVTLNLNESSFGPSKMTTGMVEFNECIDSIEVQDLSKSGLNYTWNQKPKTNDGIFKKLDRVMCNSGFIDGYPNSCACFLTYRISDHSQVLLKFPGKRKFKIKPFKFSNFLTLKPDLKNIVEREWKREVSGFSMYKLARRLTYLKKPLRKLLKESGSISEKIEILRKELDRVQFEIDKDHNNNDLKIEEEVYLQDLNEAYMEEEVFLKQKSKITWLKEGDSNSKYFHRVVKGRINRNRIETIMNKDGKWIEGEEMGNEFVNYFKDFLGKETSCSEINHAEDLFVKKLDLLHSTEMVKDVSNEEIKSALFDIEDDKSPGPDGFSAKFFKAMWEIIGDDVCKAIKEFFKNGVLLKEINATVIALIPKIGTPGKVSDFRPISCCSVIYKCISKIIVGRIRNHLGSIVS